MKEELLNRIAEYTKAADNVVIEAAHIYADEEPGIEQQVSCLVAAEVLTFINKYLKPIFSKIRGQRSGTSIITH